ncbi:MAG: hypothetical protein WCB48_08970, partial [Casimicrobiaceae bacterium]
MGGFGVGKTGDHTRAAGPLQRFARIGLSLIDFALSAEECREIAASALAALYGGKPTPTEGCG